MTREPRRAEIGTNSTRPGSCIAPVQPMAAAATAAEYPRSTRNGMRCVVTAAVAKLDTTKAIPSTQKIAVRAAWPSVRLGAAPSATPAVLPAVPWRSSSAWIGIVMVPSTTASTVSALRQPIRSSSAASIGMKIVLASPATSVTVSSARSRPRANHDTTTANAGS